VNQKNKNFSKERGSIMTKQILLTPAEEMMCLKELLAAEGDDDRRSEVAEKMLALHYQQQRAE
jgi:hypothetical protein